VENPQNAQSAANKATDKEKWQQTKKKAAPYFPSGKENHKAPLEGADKSYNFFYDLFYIYY
jgi:hypothetical protein